MFTNDMVESKQDEITVQGIEPRYVIFCTGVKYFISLSVYILCQSYTTQNVLWSRASVCLSVYMCVCLSSAVCPHYCRDPDVTWGVVEAVP